MKLSSPTLAPTLALALRCLLPLGLAAVPAAAQKPPAAGAPATPPAGAGKPEPAAPPGPGAAAPAPSSAPVPAPGSAPTPGLAPAASPGPSAAAPPAGPDALAAARSLIEATGMTAMMDQMLTGMRPNLVQALRQQAPRVPPAEVDRAVDEMLMPEFRNRLPELADSIAQIYVRNFTADELRELVAFYATPVGRKALQVMPQLLQESVALGQSWGQRVATEALTKHRASLRARGFNL